MKLALIKGDKLENFPLGTLMQEDGCAGHVLVWGRYKGVTRTLALPSQNMTIRLTREAQSIAALKMEKLVFSIISDRACKQKAGGDKHSEGVFKGRKLLLGR